MLAASASAPPTHFVLEDFNRDSHVDVVALLFPHDDSEDALGRAGVFLGEGDGGFGTPRVFGLGREPFDVAVTDVDGDGALDLVSAELGIASITVTYGRDDGTFETDERYAVGDVPRMAAPADYDGDGRLDVLVANLGGNSLSLLYGEGDGRFAPAETIALSDSPRAVLAADLDGDGRLDIAATNLFDDQVSVLLGLEAGGFGAESRYPVRPDTQYSARPRSLAAGDLDGDGDVDLITGNSGRDALAILLGEGDGTFGAPVEYEAGNFPLAVHLIDLTGDGLLDAVCLSTRDPDNSNDQGLSSVVVCPGKGDGTLDMDERSAYQVEGSPRGARLWRLGRERDA